MHQVDMQKLADGKLMMDDDHATLQVHSLNWCMKASRGICARTFSLSIVRTFDERALTELLRYFGQGDYTLAAIFQDWYL